MNIIRIDRKSIKINPLAGETSTVVNGPLDVYVTFKDIIPDWMGEMGKDYIITEWSESLNPGEPVDVTNVVYVVNPSDKIVDKIHLYAAETGKATIEIQNNDHLIHHRPEPKYFYKYQNNTVTCCECHHKERYFNLIQQDVETMCPKCFELDGMRYRHEDINDVKNKP